MLTRLLKNSFGGNARTAVSEAFPSGGRSILAEIYYLCHACSCHEIMRVETPRQVVVCCSPAAVNAQETLSTLRCDHDFHSCPPPPCMEDLHAVLIMK